MSAPWFRTTDLARWGAANSGGNLSGTQFDENTWFFQQAILALQALPSAAAGIDHFTITGNQLTVTMTDHTTRGPYTIPVSAFNFRGDWQPGTVYLVNDVFTANGACYIVIFNHTSAATFNPGANDGLGHNFYGLMIASPGSSLPSGGAAGQVLSKTSATDFATTWSWPLPTGGTTAQVLMKNSATNQDVSWTTGPWVSKPPVSPAGAAGQLLATRDGTATNTEWVDPVSISGFVSAPPASPSGVAGQLLQTVSGSPNNMEWYTIDPQLFSNIPQNLQNANYTTVATDAQKHMFHPSADTSTRTYTIDGNVNVPYPVGTAITFVNQHGAGTITIAVAFDTLRLAGAGTTGSRTLVADGVATALKITSTEWIISGTGLT